MKKIMLCYPPGDLSRKIKNRYKFGTLDVLPYTMKACNDLGYMAAVLRNNGHDIFLKDYKIEENTALDFLDDVLKYSPDMIVLCTSFANIFEDLKIVRMIKSSCPEITIVLNGDLFFDASNDLLCNLPLGGVDYLIGSDAAFVLPLLIKGHFENQDMLYQIPFITICKNGLMQKTNFHAPHGDINDLPFPARDLMKNEHYFRQDNLKVIATILTSNGCDKKCLHCREHISNGNICHIRPAAKVFEEMNECYSKYGITNFLFPLDTFSHNEKWMEELCDLILESRMNGNIEWIANVNIATFTEYMAEEMKKSGCSTVIMRFDCGTDDSLIRLNNDFSVDECFNAVEIAVKAKLKIYGLYSMGLPWENLEHLTATRKMMLKNCTDYVSLTLPVPYPDTEIEKAFREANILREPIITKDGIKIPALGTKFLAHKVVRKYRRNSLLWYYLNPKMFFKKLKTLKEDPDLFIAYIKYVWQLFRNKRH